MTRFFIAAGVIAMLAMGSAQAAPAHAGQGKSQAGHAKKQPQARMEHQVRENRDESKGKAVRAEEQVRTREERAGDSAGAERQAQMQERSQERKQIQEEYKTARRAGETEKVKGKKPWWKFWGSEDDSG